MTKIEIEIETMRALAVYSGPVKRCRPGKARGTDLPKKEDRAQRHSSNGSEPSYITSDALIHIACSFSLGKSHSPQMIYLSCRALF